MKTLYLIRHTRPDILAGICYGQLDIDTSKSFSAEAEKVLGYLPPLDLIIASPLLRTRKLAEFLAQTANCKLDTDSRMIEKNFGSWEGRHWDDIPRHEIDDWANDVMGYAPEGGESAQQLTLRAQDFLRDLSQMPQRHIALVAHGGSIRALLSLLADIPLSCTLNWQIDYGAVIAARL